LPDRPPGRRGPPRRRCDECTRRGGRPSPLPRCKECYERIAHTGPGPKPRYCSAECGEARLRRTCSFCGSAFINPDDNQPRKFCSAKCVGLNKSRCKKLLGTLGTPQCLWCEKPYLPHGYTGGRENLLFCGRTCFYEFDRECGRVVTRDWLAMEKLRRQAGLREIRLLESKVKKLKEETWRIDVPKTVLAARRRAQLAVRRLGRETGPGSASRTSPATSRTSGRPPRR